jgi:thioredoxin 1
MNVIEKTNTENFDRDVINSSTPVLVDFYADWCGPCKVLGASLEEMSKETTTKIYKIDIDNNPELASRFGIRGIPTAILFKDGIAHKTFVGVKSKTDIMAWMNG